MHTCLNMASLEKAEEIVHRLAVKYGHLDEGMMNDIQQWKPEYRRKLDESFLAMENTVAHSIKTFVFISGPGSIHYANVASDLPSKFMAAVLVLSLNFFKTRRIITLKKLPKSLSSRLKRILIVSLLNVMKMDLPNET